MKFLLALWRFIRALYGEEPDNAQKKVIPQSGKSRFETCLDRVLGHEGGLADDPRDSGGRTMQGVTQGTYDKWRVSKSLKPRDVAKITKGERDTIYREWYWEPVRGDDLPAGVDYAVFDAAVNSGPTQAIKWLQRVVSVKDDGIMGPNTLEAVRALKPQEIITAYCTTRLDAMRVMKHPITKASLWPVYVKGWTARVMEVGLMAVKDTKEA